MGNTIEAQNLFLANRKGRLMLIQPHPLLRYQYEIWFEYTREAIGEIREGAMLAVSNFASNEQTAASSILEITQVLPIHYALGNPQNKYPGFVMEAARNIALDWDQSDAVDGATEDTTVIQCVASPTNLQFTGPRFDAQRELTGEANIGMIGAEVNLLSEEAIAFVVNRGIDAELEPVISGGAYLLNPAIDILMRVEDLLKLHFGIFGFTGAGKSNLVSTLIRKILRSANDETKKDRGTKVVLFDLMGEYSSLLLDLLLNYENAVWLTIGEHTLPKPVLDYISTGREAAKFGKAVKSLTDTALLPKALLGEREAFKAAFGALIKSDRIKVLDLATELTAYEILYSDPKSISTLTNRWGQLRRIKGTKL